MALLSPVLNARSSSVKSHSSEVVATNDGFSVLGVRGEDLAQRATYRRALQGPPAEGVVDA